MPVVDVVEHRSNLLLALLCAAQFMLILDIAIVNVALPSMQRTLGLSAENIQWVVGGYAVTFGGFLSWVVGWLISSAGSWQGADPYFHQTASKHGSGR